MKTLRNGLLSLTVALCGVLMAQTTVEPLTRLSTRSELKWGGPFDPSRAGWNIAFTPQGITNLFLTDIGSPTNTNVLHWVSLTNAFEQRFFFSSVLTNLPSGTNYTLWLSARSIEGVYSDWVSIDFYNAGGIPLKPINVSFTVSYTISAPR